MAYIDLDEINRLHPKLTAKYPLSFANGISAAIGEINKLPTADVVPKSEVESIITLNSQLEAKVFEERKEIERLKKYNTDVAFKHYNDGKAELASEIFAEIERLHLHITNDFDLRRYEQLKKKYTEGVK